MTTKLGRTQIVEGDVKSYRNECKVFRELLDGEAVSVAVEGGYVRKRMEGDNYLAVDHEGNEMVVPVNMVPCPIHAAEKHGKEAEELRQGIQDIIDSSGGGDFVAVNVPLTELLERVDARDSLAYLENANLLVGGAVDVEAFDWVKHLPLADRKIFQEEMSQLVGDWKATAEVHADPKLKKKLLRSRGDRKGGKKSKKGKRK